jgi:hypothetical protein
MDAELTGKAGNARIGQRTGQGGPGPVYKLAEQEKIANQKLLEKAEANLQKHRDEEAKFEAEIAQLVRDRSAQKADDFLARFGALQKLTSQAGSGAFSVSWGLRFLFIFFEVFPALVKLFTKGNIYTALLETNWLTASDKLIRSTNNQLSSAQQPAAYPPPPFDAAVSYIQKRSVNPASATSSSP